MQNIFTNIIYTRKREQKSIIFIILILLTSSFVDEIFFYVSRIQNTATSYLEIEKDEFLGTDIVEKESHDTQHASLTNNKKNSEIAKPTKPLTVDKTILEKPEILPQLEINTHPKRQMPIDPNKATKTQLLELGVSDFASTNWVKYLDAGAKLNSKKDLEKIFGLEAEMIEKINHLMLYPIKPSYTTKVTTQVFDINEAGVVAFLRIRGIGPVLSERIIKYRENLGGFYDLNQLKEVYGVQDSVIEMNMEYFDIIKGVDQINLNSCTEKELGSHPYCGYKIARSIINYRNQHGPFENSKELSKIKLIDSNWILKIAPYLTY